MSSHGLAQHTIAVADSAIGRRSGGIAGFFGRVVRRAVSMAARLRERWRACRADDAFSRMDRRMLTDIGANRGAMFVAAYGEDIAYPHATNSNEPQRPQTIESKGVAQALAETARSTTPQVPASTRPRPFIVALGCARE